MKEHSLLKMTLAEFVGTFILVFLGGAAVASGQPVVVPAFAHGLTVLAMAYAYGHISSTVINPAVTLGLLVTGKIKVDKAIAYIVAQFAGGLLAALVLSAILGTNNVGPTTGSLTATNVWGAAAFEFVLTFILVTTIFQTAVFGKAGNHAGLAIGFVLAACILAGGTYTGASLNPARTLGPALVSGDLSYVLPYMIGLFGGGVVGALVQQYVFGPVE